MIMVDQDGAGTKYLPPYGSGCICEGTAGRVNKITLHPRSSEHLVIKLIDEVKVVPKLNRA